MRLNFVKLQEIDEEEDLERWPRPIILPCLTKEINATEFCVENYHPVLLAYRVELKSRPTGFLTPSSTLRFGDLSYQSRIVTKLFTSLFISRKREHAMKNKRKSESQEEPIHKKPKVIPQSPLHDDELTVISIIENPESRTEGDTSLPPSDDLTIDTSPSTAVHTKPISTRNMPNKNPPSSSLKPIQARRKAVHSMPEFKFKRIPIRKVDDAPTENRSTSKLQKPVVLPVYSMNSSSDEDEIINSLFRSSETDLVQCIDERTTEVSEELINRPKNNYEESLLQETSENKNSDLSFQSEIEISSMECIVNGSSSEYSNNFNSENTIIDPVFEVSMEQMPTNIVHVPLREAQTSDILDNSLSQHSPKSDTTPSKLQSLTTPLDSQPSTPTTSKASQSSFNSFSLLLSEAKRMPERFLGKFWQSPKRNKLPTSAEGALENDSAEISLEDPNNVPNQRKSSLSQFLTNVYKRGEQK